jgi:hypothetical protein
MASFPAFTDTTTAQGLDPGNLCDVCAKIPFHALPSEEENAYPHYPTLHALEESAQICGLCALLYWAAGCSLIDYGGMVTFHPSITLQSGEKIRLRSTEGMYNGMGMRAFENGAMMLDFSAPVADPRPPLQADLKDRFPNGTMTRNGTTEQVRPWLFGNWYESDFGEREEPLMIGLGVRLGTSGRIEDSVDRENDTVHIRGSYLRYRTDKGA